MRRDLTMNAMMRTAAAGLLLVIAVAGAGCVREPLPESMRIDTSPFRIDESSSTGSRAANTTEQTVELEGASSADVTLSMGAGEMTVGSSDTSALAEATFEYSNSAWRPSVSYEVKNSVGALTIDQPEVRIKFGADNANLWDVRLGKGIPVNLDVHLGAGRSDLDLSQVDVRELAMSLGAGETTVDLTGPRTEDVTADIQAGIGELTVKLPKDVGVKVTGAKDGVGELNADGFKVDGDAYINDAYGTSPVTIELNVQKGVGQVNLELE
jgi:hypothetical protein